MDADAFYVSVELRRRPELRGLPVVVAGSGPRAVVTTASYEARRYGVGSAMPASRARRLCPQAVFLTPDFPAYREASAQVMGIVREHVETVEVVGLDEAYLDLEGLYSPRAAMRRLIAEIRGATQLACSVGIGPNKLVAKVASDAEKPAGFVVLTREQACARFAGSPPSLIPGIGPKTAARLSELGIATLGQMAAMDPEVLVERFGKNLGRDLARRARFEHDGEVAAARKVVSESRERTFDVDIGDPASCGQHSAGWPTSCARASPGTGAAAARSASRCAWTTGRRRRAPTRSRRRPPTRTIVERPRAEAARGVRTADGPSGCSACACPAGRRAPGAGDSRAPASEERSQLALPV